MGDNTNDAATTAVGKDKPDEQEFKERALDYNRKGKIGVRLSKKIVSQDDLSLAYTPGVAYACRAIEENPISIYEYTNKHNSVAVLTDGTAVLGLGDIGPAASLPVMEGKSALFAKFAGIDAWPVAVSNARVDGNSGRTDVEKLIAIAASVSIQYGGINLEDIAAPECFEVERRLKEMLDIPVFHDDQHGTAIVTLAALKNYLALSGKEIEKLKIAIIGAGAAGISIAKILKSAGATNIILCDSRGVIYEGREGVNRWKAEFAIITDARTIKDALVGADVLIGVSKPGLVDIEMIRSMNDMPAVFPLSNPVSEIMPEDVIAARVDAYIATGRSDYPNQVNNALVFPYIFRGALDVMATDINEEMKLAAADAIALLAREEVPKDVLSAYGIDKLSFGKDYLLPKPIDPRLLIRVSMAVAEAAIRSGTARKKLVMPDYEKVLFELQSKIANDEGMMKE